MAAVLLSAAATLFAALFLGQAALRLAGAREWSWLAPLVGISIAMMVATPAIHVPGRTVTVFAVLGALAVAAAIWCLRSPSHRPPPAELLAVAPVALLVLLPFLAAGRVGILGVSINNDMAPHLTFVESYVSAAAAEIAPLPKDYPLGPHAMVALLTAGFGVRPELAFTGWTMALPLLNAWTALAVCRRASWLGKAVAATVVGMPFLVAAYYGEGAFKEVLQAGLVLAFALALSGCGPRLGRNRWVPLALLAGGIVSVYSVTGLPWPAAFLVLWLVGLAAIRARRDGVRAGLRRAAAAVRTELPAVGIGLAVLALGLLPQAPRLIHYVTERRGTGIAVEDIGNLVGPLPGWEALGVWNNQDFRLPASPAFNGGLWAAFVLALVLIGGFWALRRGRWPLPAAAAAAMAIWAASDQTQSPYVSAKGLVIASPLLLLLAVLPLVDREARRPPWWPLVPILALVLLFKVGVSDERALRWSPVGPTDHLAELRTFRPLVAGQPTLFLGHDDFIRFALAGAPVDSAVIGGSADLPLRPRKRWQYGQAVDVDSVRARILNRYEWVVATRDAAASALPAQLRPAKITPHYVLWHRVGRVGERSILGEGEWPGRILECDTGAGRKVLAGGGFAAIRPLPRVAVVPAVAPGANASAQLTLDAGAWELETPYTSPQPVEVTSPLLSETLPPNLDRPGPRWRLGRVILPRDRRLVFNFHVEETPLTSAATPAVFNTLIATPAGRDRIVPVDEACGRYVDWYRSGSR